MAKALRIGIIGCGKIATCEHARGFGGVPGVRVTALCDIVPARAKALRDAAAPGAAVFKDYCDLLRSDVDAVAVATPNYLHCPMALDALRAGKHVFCEKPLAGLVADATRMVAAARRARRILHVNQSFHYIPLYVTIADLVAAGEIGEPVHVRCIRAGYGTPDKNWSPGARWFVQKKAQGGLIFDIAVHMADFMKWCCGPVAQVAAVTDTRTAGIDVTDHAAAVFRFVRGATGVLELSWAMPAGAGLLELYGTRGKLRTGFGEKPIELIRPDGGVSYPEVKTGTPSSHAAFVDAVRGKGKTPTPGELGREAVALCEAIERSGASGRFVRVRNFAKGK